MDIVKFCKDNSTMILTGAGVAGVISTAVLAAKATPKALDILAEKEKYKQEKYGYPLTRFEKVLAMSPAYIPAALMGIATTACILGANHINQVRQSELLAAYACLDASFIEYRHKVNDIFGSNCDKMVMDEIEKERYLSEQYGDISEKKLFYEQFSNRYFEMSIYEVMKATYDANRMYAFCGNMSLNQLYEFFNLAPTKNGDKIGWSAYKDWECYGSAWLDIRWEAIETPDGLEAFGITFNIDPSRDFGEWQPE